MNNLRIATWNLEWATTGTANFPTIERRLAAVDPDIAVLTEMTVGTAARWPYVIDAGTHPDICTGNKRKVAIASKYPLTLIDAVGSPQLPPANFVAVDAHIPGGGPVRVIGIVVRWFERKLYLDHLPDALDKNLTHHTIVAGVSCGPFIVNQVVVPKPQFWRSIYALFCPRLTVPKGTKGGNRIG